MMEFLAELIIEVFLEGIFGLTVENPKVKTWVKTWVKTLIFVLFSQAITAAFLRMTLSSWQEENKSIIVLSLITVLWCVGTLIGAVHGHRTNWKQKS